MKTVYVVVMSQNNIGASTLISVWKNLEDAAMEANRLNDDSCYTLYHVREEKVN